MLPSWAHVLGFGVLQEIIERCHMRDRQTFGAIQEATLQNVSLEKRPGRLQRKLLPANMFFLVNKLFRSQRGVAIHGLEMLGKRAAREV